MLDSIWLECDIDVAGVMVIILPPKGSQLPPGHPQLSITTRLARQSCFRSVPGIIRACDHDRWTMPGLIPRWSAWSVQHLPVHPLSGHPLSGLEHRSDQDGSTPWPVQQHGLYRRRAFQSRQRREQAQKMTLNWRITPVLAAMTVLPLVWSRSAIATSSTAAPSPLQALRDDPHLSFGICPIRPWYGRLLSGLPSRGFDMGCKGC